MQRGCSYVDNLRVTVPNAHCTILSCPEPQNAALQCRAEAKQLGVLGLSDGPQGASTGPHQPSAVNRANSGTAPGAATQSHSLQPGHQHQHEHQQQHQHSGTKPARWGCGSYAAARRGIAVFKQPSLRSGDLPAVVQDNAEGLQAIQPASAIAAAVLPGTLTTKAGPLDQPGPRSASSALHPDSSISHSEGAAGTVQLHALGHEPGTNVSVGVGAPSDAASSPVALSTASILEVLPEALDEVARGCEGPLLSLHLAIDPPSPDHLPLPSPSFILRSQAGLNKESSQTQPSPKQTSPPQQQCQQGGDAEAPLLVLSSQEESELQLRLQSPRGSRGSAMQSAPSTPDPKPLPPAAGASRGPRSGRVKALQEVPPSSRRTLALHRGPNGQVSCHPYLFEHSRASCVGRGHT